MKFLPREAVFVIDKLRAKGYEAFAVGGCVRDLIMNIPINDCDITTSATTDEIKDVFQTEKTVETGIKHGTVTVIINGSPIEITTFRIESSYSDNRRPDSVIFTKSLSEDLARRDFTINSIAYSNETGFIDLYNGIKDIEKRIIRCVGDPTERFKEDSLRILRAMRFSSVLGFEIETETKKAMLKCAHLVRNLSKERIFSELSKLICGKNIRKVMTEFSPVLGQIIPEINDMKGFQQHNFHHIYDVLEHTAAVVESIPQELHLRLAALFHDIAKPYCFTLDENGIGHFYSHASKGLLIAEKRLTELRCDNKTKESVLLLIKAHDTPIEESEKIIKRRLNSMGKELFFDLIKLKRADTAGLAPQFSSRNTHFDRLEEIAGEIIKRDDCFSLRHLAVKGNDLIDLGFKGREIGEKLNYLLEAVIDGRCSNERDDLISLAKKSHTAEQI